MFVARNALKFQSDEKWCTNYENNKLGTYISFEMASCKYENKKIAIMQQPTSYELNVQLIDFVHFIYLFFVPCEVWIELPRIVVERVPISNAFIIWVIMRTKWQHKSTGTDFGFWVFFLSVCAKKFACRQPIMACEHLLIATKPKCRPIVVNEQDLFFMCSLIAILANTFERHKMMGRPS